MTDIYEIKENDREPVLPVNVVDENDAAVDLTNVNDVRLLVVNSSTGATIVDTTLLGDADFTWVDQANGQMQYAWKANEATPVCEFEVEVHVTWASGKPQAFPTNGTARGQIRARKVALA